ncbi:MAG: glycosyltransferase family 2 protein [Rhizobiaceae bacterium]|jgi:glycosyltransferase involved in cell wall biosynthesis
MGVEASLIVPTRNRADILRLSLPRFQDQTVARERYEIVIVDDASDDDTPAAVEENAAPNIVYRRHETQKAAAYARNRAIEAASGKLLLFVDDDALVRPDFIEQHLITHEQATGLVVSGPIVECSKPPAERNPPAGWMLGRHSNPFATGNASIARETILRAGMFDEDFGTYGWEDSEMYRRLVKTGVKRHYNWRAPIYHYKPETVRRSFFDRIRLEQKRGAMGAIYYAKHPIFGVAFETKQLGLFRWLDRVVDGAIGLSDRLEKAIESGEEPRSAFMRLLLVLHTEIDVGRRTWEQLGPEKRKAMESETIARVRPA